MREMLSEDQRADVRRLRDQRADEYDIGRLHAWRLSVASPSDRDLIDSALAHQRKVREQERNDPSVLGGAA